jgi:hypothetical protein
MIYPSQYTRPDLVAQQLEKADPANPPDPAQAQYDDFFDLVDSYCLQASAYVTHLTGRSFVPYYHTYTLRQQTLAERRLSAFGTLYLPDDLIEAVSVEENGVALAGSEYYLVAHDHWGTRPFIGIRRSSGWGLAAAFDDEVTVEGWWGFARTANWSTHVENVTTSASATTIAVTGAYKRGEYLRVGSELLRVRGATATTITVERGVNGTTAAAHTGASLRRVNVLADVQLAATRLAAWLYQRRADTVGRVQLADGSALVAEMPSAVREVLSNYVRWGRMSV